VLFVPPDSNCAAESGNAHWAHKFAHERPGFPSLAVGFKRISTTNEGDKRFASVSQASASKFGKTLVFEEKSANDFYERGMTRDRADLRISFA
jgi:hypothetical protein